ncbi:MAG: hypothetical protein IT458_20880 [Planctomycetes bacterium]|nr:hypothetical protein [Planctomycetota bacterium]
MKRVTRLFAILVSLCFFPCCSTSSGNLYFLSVQRLGLEVAASDPASNATPKILIGYESLKGTINPVKNADGTLRAQAYSVLGITNAAVAGPSSTSVGVAEWFATGHAADLLADNPMTPAALNGSIQLTPELIAAASSRQLAFAVDGIINAVVWIDADTAPAEDKALVAALDTLGTLVDSLKFKTIAPNGKEDDFTLLATSKGWDRLVDARSKLSSSITHAVNRSQQPTGVADADKMRKAASDLAKLKNDLDRRILASSEAQAVWNRMTDIIRQGGRR